MVARSDKTDYTGSEYFHNFRRRDLNTKPIITALICTLLFSLVAACRSTPSPEELQSAVEETMAAMPTQPQEELQVIEVTQVLEVTKFAVIEITTTPAPTKENTATPTPTDTLEASPTPEPVLESMILITETPTPVTESGPLNLGFNQLIRRYTNMTDLQKQEFVKTLPGKTIYWNAEVYNITTDGTLVLDNPYGVGRVTLKGTPIETALEIDRGMLVDFRGMIQSFGGSFGREIVIINADIVRYYYPPTPTPTSTRRR
jgi:hypothetical protein